MSVSSFAQIKATQPASTDLKPTESILQKSQVISQLDGFPPGWEAIDKTFRLNPSHRIFWSSPSIFAKRLHCFLFVRGIAPIKIIISNEINIEIMFLFAAATVRALAWL